MNKLLIVLFSIITYQYCYASLNWNEQELGQTYSIEQDIKLYRDEKKYSLPAKTKLKLIEKSALSMIKVHLHKYELPGCTLGAIETDLQLIPVKKRSNKKTSVGVNLLKGCRLEIFVDMEEYSTISFLE